MPDGIPYTLECAKSGRARCKGQCKELIEKGALRLGSEIDMGGHMAVTWKCLPCLTAKVVMNIMSKVEAAEDIPGFTSLSEEQQEQVEQRFQAAIEEGEAEKERKEQEKKDKAKAKAEAKKAKAAEKAASSKSPNSKKSPSSPKKTAQKRKASPAKSPKASSSSPTAKKAKQSKPATPNKGASGPNAVIADLFTELCGFCFKEGDKFKGVAYRKVALALQEHPDKIETGKEAMKLKGVGKASGEKIQEYLDTGKIEKLEEYKSKWIHAGFILS